MSTISCSLKPVAAKVGAASTKSNSKHSVITRKPFNVTGTAVKSNVNGLVALGKLDCSAIEYRHFFTFPVRRKTDSTAREYHFNNLIAPHRTRLCRSHFAGNYGERDAKPRPEFCGGILYYFT